MHEYQIIVQFENFHSDQVPISVIMLYKIFFIVTFNQDSTSSKRHTMSFRIGSPHSRIKFTILKINSFHVSLASQNRIHRKKSFWLDDKNQFMFCRVMIGSEIQALLTSRHLSLRYCRSNWYRWSELLQIFTIFVHIWMTSNRWLWFQIAWRNKLCLLVLFRIYNFANTNGSFSCEYYKWYS